MAVLPFGNSGSVNYHFVVDHWKKELKFEKDFALFGGCYGVFVDAGFGDYGVCREPKG